jgi:hypothetical protein
MSTLIISGSRGTDDPTMATLPFIAAKASKEATKRQTLAERKAAENLAADSKSEKSN